MKLLADFLFLLSIIVFLILFFIRPMMLLNISTSEKHIPKCVNSEYMVKVKRRKVNYYLPVGLAG